MNFLIKKLTLSIFMLFVLNQAHTQATDELGYAYSKSVSDQIFETFSEYAYRYLEILQQEKTYPLMEALWRQLISEQNSKKRKVLLADFNKRYGNEIQSAIRLSGINSVPALTSTNISRYSTQVELYSEYGILIYSTGAANISPAGQLGLNCRTKNSETILPLEFERENGPAEINGCALFDGGHSAVKQFATAQCGYEFNFRHLDYEIPGMNGCDVRLIAQGEISYSFMAYAGLGPLNILAGSIVKINNKDLPHLILVHTGRMVNFMLLPFTSTESGVLNAINNDLDYYTNCPVEAGANYNFEYTTVARVVGGRHGFTDAKVSSTIKDVKSPRLITYVTR